MTERDPRVWFAAERTFLAWIRTGLALMGLGFVVARFGIFLRELAIGRGVETLPGGGSVFAGVALVMIGVAVNLYAALAHLRFRRHFEAGDPLPHSLTFGIALASVLALLGISIAIYLVVRGF